MTETVADRIEQAIAAAETNPRAVSVAAGMSPDAVRGILRNRDGSPTVETIRKIAMALDVSPEWLAYGLGPGPSDAPVGSTLGVIGYIAGGGSIDTSSEQINHADPIFEVRVPFPVPEDALAFQIKGPSMWPRYDDGDVIICSRFSEHPDGVIGFPAGVETADGSRYLKRVLNGSRPGLYHLESYNAPLMTDVQVVSFSSVIAVIPASQVKTVTDHVRRNVLRQIKSGKVARG